VYVNSYLGSLNARGVLLSRQEDANMWSPPANGRGIALSVRHNAGVDGFVARQATKRPPVIHVERSTVYHDDSDLPSAKGEFDGGRSHLEDMSVVDLERAESMVCAQSARDGQ
jgi:hypothetical protein